MIKFIHNIIKKLFVKQPKIVVKHSKIPMYHSNKHYNDMNRNERREYKRWLAKNDLWDGAVVIENLERKSKLRIDGKKK